MPVTVGILNLKLFSDILERVLVGNIVNIRNECIFFLVHGERIVEFRLFVCPAL